MNLQYLTDEEGEKTAVVVPIEEWHAMEEREEFFRAQGQVPGWQKEIVAERMKNFEKNPKNTISSEEVFTTLFKKY